MQQGYVRIIAGKWRGRRLAIPSVTDLRPTPDRVRETLFNWLSMEMPGAHCLDLFAGTGVLGFEALSRGAAHVTMIDSSQEVINVLQEQVGVFSAKENARVYRANVPSQLQKPERPYDVVFLDPPYRDEVLFTCCAFLEEHGYLAKQAYIYLESPTQIEQSQLPPNWQIAKSGKAGMVFYHLAHRDDQYADK